MHTVDDIIEWAEARNLVSGSTPQAQMLKLFEEGGELAAAIARGDNSAIKDSIGDMVVVLTILSAQCSTDLRHCTALAYEEIRHRKGRMENGIFIKEE